MADWTPPEVAGWTPPEVAKWSPPEVAQAKRSVAQYTAPRSDLDITLGGLKAGAYAGAREAAGIADMVFDALGSAIPSGTNLGSNYLRDLVSGTPHTKERAEQIRADFLEVQENSSPHMWTKLVDFFKPADVEANPTHVGKMMETVMNWSDTDMEAVEERTHGYLKAADMKNIRDFAINALAVKGGKATVDSAMKKAKPAEAKPAESSNVINDWASKADEPLNIPPETRDPTLTKLGSLDAEGKPIRKDAGKIDQKVLIGLGLGGAAAAVVVPIIQDYLDGKKSKEEAERLLQQESKGRVDSDTTTPPEKFSPKLPDHGAPMPKTPLDPLTEKMKTTPPDAGKDILTPIGEAGIGLAALLALGPKTALKDIHPDLSYTTKVLTDLNDSMGGKFDFTKEHVLQRANKPTVGKFEREMYQDIMADRQSISARDLVAEVKKRTGDFELKARETDKHANDGLKGIDRLGEENQIWDENGHSATEHLAPPSRTTVYELPSHNIDLTPLEDAINLVTDERGNRVGHIYFENSMGHTRSFDEDGVRHVIETQNNQAQYAEKALRQEAERNPPLSTEDRSKAEAHLADIKTKVGEYYSLLSEAMTPGKNSEVLQKLNQWPEFQNAWRRGENNAEGLIRRELYRIQELELNLKEKLEKETPARRAYESIKPMWKDWYKRIIREEVAGVRLTATGALAVTVMAAEADLVVSATLVAFTV